MPLTYPSNKTFASAVTSNEVRVTHVTIRADEETVTFFYAADGIAKKAHYTYAEALAAFGGDYTTVHDLIKTAAWSNSARTKAGIPTGGTVS